MNWSRLIAPAAGFLGVVGYYWLYRAAGPTSRADVRVDTDRVSCQAEKAEVQALRSEVLRLQGELREGRDRVGAAADDGRDHKATTRARDERPQAPPTPEQEAAWLQARSEFYDGVLKRESRDNRWAGALEAKALAIAKDQKDQGVDLVEARCYTSHCRFEYSYRDEGARTAHLHTVPRAFPELHRASYAYPGAPAVLNRAVIYLSKAEEPMPSFDYDAFIAKR